MAAVANKSRLGCILAVLAAFGVLAMIGVVALALLLPRWLTGVVVREARERGVELTPGDVEFGLGWISVTDAKFALVGVKGIHGRARRINVELDGFDARRIDAYGLTIDVEGSAATLALEMGEWTRAYPKTYRLAFSARDVDLTWRARPGAEVFLRLENGSVVPVGNGGTFEAARASLTSVDLGRIGARWNSEQSLIALGFGAKSLEEAILVARVHHTVTPPTAEITLKPTPMERLAGPLNVPLPAEGVSVSGEAKLVFAPGVSSGPVDGTVTMHLDGWIPPHPRELDGFVFGRRTTFQTNFHVPEDRQRADLTESRVQAGAFRLDGRGTVTREEEHAHIEMTLKGQLACVALAGAAAESYLGRTLGKLVGAAAQHAFQGSVAVVVRIDAHTRDLGQAKVLRTIGIGCGLKPFPIDVPELLKELPKLLPDMPPGLLSIPSSLPPIPTGFSTTIQFPPAAPSTKSSASPQ